MSTKAEAVASATAREAEVRAGKATGIQMGRTVGDAFHRYEKEVSATTRGHRLNTDNVSGSTVNRELNLLSNVFTVAAKEWKWISASPTTDVRRPKDSEARDRLYTEHEIERVCLALGFDLNNEQPATTVSQRVAVAFLLRSRPPWPRCC